jgi:hypothetical protein
MKRFLIVLLCLLLILLTACKVQDNHIPDSYKDKDEYFDTEGFADFTDFCKYYYDANADTHFASMSEYQAVTDEDKGKLTGYFNDFVSWIALRKDCLDQYNFDPKTYITVGDYYYIKTKEGQYTNYTVYYYDTETHTLYYIHNNI